MTPALTRVAGLAEERVGLARAAGAVRDDARREALERRCPHEWLRGAAVHVVLRRGGAEYEVKPHRLLRLVHRLVQRCRRPLRPRRLRRRRHHPGGRRFLF